MVTLNNNACMVLASIREKDGDIGLCEGRGMTRDRIVSKTNLSPTTVIRALKLLISCGYVNEGIRQISKKTYYITKEGVNKLIELNKKSI